MPVATRFKRCALDLTRTFNKLWPQVHIQSGVVTIRHHDPIVLHVREVF
jgi:hypothetical protein